AKSKELRRAARHPEQPVLSEVEGERSAAEWPALSEAEGACPERSRRGVEGSPLLKWLAPEGGRFLTPLRSVRNDGGRGALRLG
ncbi:MAG: hypothetical protein RBT75_07260, partial [Anaerolineae bacterium]|nr:hypothetical protein [Anaerolineae bacterium]